jgi:hypothetical protein
MKSVLVLLAVLVAAPAAIAAEPDATENGRYAMTPAPDGFLRLDTRTGATALCRINGGSVTCRAAAEESRALNEEIDRLTRDNADLRGKLAAGQGGSKYGLPSDQEIDKALGIGERFMRRMMKILRDEPGPDNL